MTLRVATVLSARDWESRLVAAARASASVRLLLRAFLPDEVLDRSGDLDVVVVGSETPWASAARIRAWSRAGLRVTGIHPPGDRPAAERLREAGADLVLPDDLPAETLLREIRLLEPAAARPDATSSCVAVTGARGAPGRTEISLALAWIAAGSSRATLVDADLEAPAIAIRMGIDPKLDLADAVDAVHEEGTVPDRVLHRVGRLGVITGAHRIDEPRLRPEPVFDVIDALRIDGPVVVDTGPWPAGLEIIKSATTTVVVVEASPIGIVRAATILQEWTGPPPRLVVNRVGRSNLDSVEAARKWTGLDPIGVVRFLPAAMQAARSGSRPSRRMVRQLIEVME